MYVLYILILKESFVGSSVSIEMVGIQVQI